SGCRTQTRICYVGVVRGSGRGPLGGFDRAPPLAPRSRRAREPVGPAQAVTARPRAGPPPNPTTPRSPRSRHVPPPRRAPPHDPGPRPPHGREGRRRGRDAGRAAPLPAGAPGLLRVRGAVGGRQAPDRRPRDVDDRRPHPPPARPGRRGQAHPGRLQGRRRPGLDPGLGARPDPALPPEPLAAPTLYRPGPSPTV